NMLQLVIPGSSDLSSDIDATFDYPVDKPWIGVEAVRMFNAIFEKNWGRPSGIVFDVNVYTPGFMPLGMRRFPTSLAMSLKERVGALKERRAGFTDDKESRGLRYALNRRRYALKSHIRGEMKDLDRSRQPIPSDIEDIMSLLKIRRFMSVDQ